MSDPGADLGYEGGDAVTAYEDGDSVSYVYGRNWHTQVEGDCPHCRAPIGAVRLVYTAAEITQYGPWNTIKNPSLKAFLLHPCGHELSGQTYLARMTAPSPVLSFHHRLEAHDA